MKLIVIRPFRDKFTKEDYEVGRKIECDDDLAKSRLNLGLVEQIVEDNHSSGENSIPSTESKKEKKSKEKEKTNEKSEEEKSDEIDENNIENKDITDESDKEKQKEDN